MFGSVADGSEPVLGLTLLSVSPSDRAAAEINAVIDTGFDGELTLPAQTIRLLGYPYVGTAGAVLADVSEVQSNFHTRRVLWHGEPREVAVLAAEGEPLVGVGLLAGSRLTVEATPSGAVLVKELR